MHRDPPPTTAPDRTPGAPCRALDRAPSTPTPRTTALRTPARRTPAHRAPAHRTPARRRRAVVLALVVGLTGGLGAHAAATRVQLTDAAWTDREYVSGTLGTRATWCDTGLYRTAGRGQLVAGQVGAGGTGTVPAVAPLRVTQTGSGSSATPAGATSLGSDAWALPLTPSALQAAAVPLGGTVTFPGSPTAAQTNQYARATSTGLGAGASGAVSDAGVVAAGTQSAGSGLPDLATVDLRALVGPTAFQTALGSAPSADLTGVRLVPGLVASSTVRDGCISRPSATRAYGVSSLRLEADSTALRAAATTATTAAAGVQNAVTGTAAGSVPATAAANVRAVLVANQEVLNLMTPGPSTATLVMSVPVNVPAAVAPLTGQTLGAGGPVRLDLATGRMTVDVGALTSATAGVNGRPPNTEVLTAAILESAATTVGTLLPAYRTAVLNAISTALATSTATLTVTTTYSLLNLGVLITEPAVLTFVGTLNQLHARQGTLTASVGVNNTCGLVTLGSCNSVRNFANSANGITLLRTAVANALTSTIYGTSTTAPVPPSGTVVAAVAAATGTLPPALRALPTVVSAQVNVQPDVAGARTPGVTFAAGEAGVSALRIGATDAGRTAWLAFGTSAAGPLSYHPPGS